MMDDTISGADPARARLLEQLRGTDHVPVLIVGGGINGMGTFRDLSLQGVDCLLVEQHDYCFGASRAPSRMIHGGLKYMETGEFRLVRESASERNRLLHNAAHYVKPLEMIIPIHSWFGGTVSAIKRFFRRPAKMNQRGALIVKLGLWLYDIYGSRNRTMPRHRMIPRADILSEIPDMDPSITSAASYYDAWILSPERLVVELALDGVAANPGNIALNHVRFTGVKGNRAELLDLVSGEIFSLSCDIMINAAGAWINMTNASAGAPGKLVGGNRGSHLMLNLPALAKTLQGRMIYFEADGGRICILSNFMGHVLLGSTDIPTDDPDSVVCLDDEVDYLLAAFTQLFPKVPVSRDDIFFSYAGIRPLPASDADDPGAISRDHSIVESSPAGERRFPILSLIGGKWTTFRAFSAEVTDATLSRLGANRRTTTEQLPIGGGVGLSPAAAPTEALLSDIVTRFDLLRSRAEQLVMRYGSRATPVAAAIGPNETLLSKLPEFSREEIAYVCDAEQVVHAEDFLFGRSSVFLERPLDLSALQELVDVLADHRGWPAGRKADEVERLITRFRTLHRIDVLSDGGKSSRFA